MTIWVTEEKRCIDCHRDFISGGGFTEPSLFVAGLLQDKDFSVSHLRWASSLSRPQKTQEKSKAEKIGTHKGDAGSAGK